MNDQHNHQQDQPVDIAANVVIELREDQDLNEEAAHMEGDLDDNLHGIGDRLPIRGDRPLQELRQAYEGTGSNTATANIAITKHAPLTQNATRRDSGRGEYITDTLKSKRGKKP